MTAPQLEVASGQGFTGRLLGPWQVVSLSFHTGVELNPSAVAQAHLRAVVWFQPTTIKRGLQSFQPL